jgi:hypothetical protein
MADDRDFARVGLGKRAQKCEPGERVAHLPRLQQLKLQSVARLLPVCGEFGVHEIEGARPLVGGKSDAAAEKVQEEIAVAGEDRAEQSRLLFVRPEPLQFIAGAATPVIEQDGGKGPAAPGTKEQCAERQHPAAHDDRFGPK